jgi:ADP-heptose:LPS heptosyltransferase
MDLGLGEAESEEVQAWLRQHGARSVEHGAWSKEQGVGSVEQGASNTLRPKPSAPSPTLPANSVGVGVGSKMQSKRWPLERFEEVLQQLIDSRDITPVFFGGPEDTEAAEQLIHKLGRGLNACGQLSLRGSARALQDCRFYLGNDTGTMHLAVAAGIKCVAIFSARDVPGKWYPYGEGHKVHRVPVDCEGCMLYECHEQGRKCLLAIQPEEVYNSCVELLDAKTPKN